MKQHRKLLVFLATLFTTVFLVSCANTAKSNSQSSKKEETVKIGIIGSDERIWDFMRPELKKKGINLKIVQFTSYDQPNQALYSGDIDLNSYQHIFYLDNWNKAHHGDLVSIGDTVLAPMTIYSKKIKNISKLKNGDEISIPNDPTNQARALQLLEAAKVISLRSQAKLPSPNDVVKNPKKIKITPLDASQTARSLDDVTVAVINSGVALDAKLPANEAIFTEKITAKSKPWINIIATKKKNKNKKIYQEIVKTYQSDRVAKKIKEVYHGTSVPAWNKKF